MRKIPFKNTSNPKGTRARFISTAVKKVDRYGKEQTSVNFLWNMGFNSTPKLFSEVYGCLCSIVWRKS